MEKLKSILKDIARNFWFPLLAGLALFAVITLYVKDFDESNMHWYYISITIISGGGVACIVYGLKKLFSKK